MGINLGTLFLSRKSEPTPPEIAGVAVAKSDNPEGYIEPLKELGIEVREVLKDNPEFDLLVVTDKKMTEGLTTFKASATVGVLIENVEKSFDPWTGGTSFSENLKTSGFFPGVGLAMSVLEDTIYNVMFSEDGKATDGIQKAVEDFGQYVTKLVKAIPPTAFKMEKLVPVTKAEEETTTETGTETTETTNESTETAAKEETTTTEEAAPETSTETTETVEKTEDPLTKLRDEMLAGLSAAVTAAMEPVTTEITQKLSALETRMTSVEDIAKKAEEAVKGTVVMTPTEDKDSATAKKGDTEEGVFDSAFSFPGYEN